MAKSWLPEEITNLKLVIEQFVVISRTASNHRISLFVNIIFLLGGSATGYFLSVPAQDKILDSLVAFCGIMIGFVITAMLFSGKNQSADSLELDQAKLYALKTKFILLSQTQTLVAFIICVGFCLFAIISKTSQLSIFDNKIIFALAIGYFCLGLYRTLFLPFQIYDVHSFALDTLIKDKEKQATQKVATIRDGFNQVK